MLIHLRTIVWVGLLLVALSQPLSAIPLQYDPTPSTGSWDGPGKTAAELIGSL
jgi:hypothetical protein